MKSISIVYRRPKAPDTKKQQPTDMRTTANEYYTRLLQRGVNREEIMQKIRSKTAKASKLLDRKNVFSSLSIASISTPQPMSLVKSGTEKKLQSPTIFNIKKPKSDTIFSLKLPDYHQKQHHKMDHFIRRSPTKQLLKHAKLKTLCKIKCQKDVTLVISVDFIYNEFNFWGEEQVEDSCARTWKLLAPLVNLVWIVRSQATAKKIVYFTQCKGLRLDGILQIEPNKKQSLTISYSTLQQQAHLPRSHKLLIINSLRSDPLAPSPTNPSLSEFQFRSSLPILSHPTTFVHFVRIDMGNRNRFAAIKRVVTQELPAPYDLHAVMEGHRERKGRFMVGTKKIYENYMQQIQDSQHSLTQKMQTLKSDLLSYFQQSFGLKHKLEGDSLTYIIGDMIKRNYNIAKEYYSYCGECEEREQERDIMTMDREMENRVGANLRKFQYGRPVYVWELG